MAQRFDYIVVVSVLMLSIYSSTSCAMETVDKCTSNRTFVMNGIDPKFTKACVHVKDPQQVSNGSQNVLHELIVYDNKGLETVVDSIVPIYPWFRLELLQDRNNQQWILLEYYADVDRQDGKTYRFIIYNLKYRERVFTSFSTHSIVVEDLDSDGLGEFVFSHVLVPIPYSIQVGWPRVYRLRDNIEAIDDKALIKPYILNLKSQSLDLLNHFKEICSELENSGNPCKAEKISIVILENQIQLVEHWVQQSVKEEDRKN